MREIEFIIRENEPVTDGVYRLVLECSAGEHGITAPGQFINIKIDGLFLRRPISICDWTETTVTVIYKVVGKGTEILKTYEPGRSLNALSSLGNGFAPARAGERPLLIGGGVGVPPLYGLCRNLIEAGARPTVILGFNTEHEVFYKEEFEKLGAEVLVATADGSMGQKGFVTDVLRNIKVPATFFYTCGPEPMLKALDKALAEGDLDLNSYQHAPFLANFAKQNNAKLVPIGNTILMRMGIYSNKIHDINAVPDGSVVAIPNDPTNGGRGLVLLEKAGLIKLKEGVGFKATAADVAENPKHLKFKELEAAQLPRSLDDVDLAVITMNYVMSSGMDVKKQGLFWEKDDEPLAVMVLAAREKDKDNPTYKKIADLFHSDAVKKFIGEKFKGTIIPAK